jgi:CRP-like cAMP-binding protein
VRAELCQVLAEDPDLGRDLAAGRLEEATDAVLARVVRLGTHDAGRLSEGLTNGRPEAERGAGFLILEGLLLRRVGVSGRVGAEVLGAGDLLRPWEGEDDEPTLAPSAAWRVLQDCRLAVLDVAFLGRVARYPEVAGRVAGRALRRARHLGILMAIVHQPRLEVRLHMLLWQLAGRWGRVSPDGVRVRLPLSHTALAELVAARRPSVTAALGRLTDQGLIRVEEDGWLLCGGPPSELAELGAMVPAAAAH